MTRPAGELDPDTKHRTRAAHPPSRCHGLLGHGILGHGSGDTAVTRDPVRRP